MNKVNYPNQALNPLPQGLGELDGKILKLEGQHATLVAYLRTKLDQRDWHGVSDAANDLRVLEETIRMERAWRGQR